MPGPTIEVQGDDINGLRAEIRDVRAEIGHVVGLIEAEHRQRLEYARIEHERRMELIEDEAALVDEKYRRLAARVMPTPDQLREIRAKLPPSEINYDEEAEMPY